MAFVFHETMKSLKRKSIQRQPGLPRSRQSRRFFPTGFTEKIVPVLLAMLVLGLLIVFVIIVSSLMGVTPSA
jgi:hypothetical protein